jgi:uncharacterized protein (DUF1015 family)
MVQVFCFAAVRPEPSLAPKIAAVPYDVVSREEAAEEIRKNPLSFLRVSRADAELFGIPPYDPQVYRRAQENFTRMIDCGQLYRDPVPGMYIYRVQQGQDCFIGLCCCLGVRDYHENRIRRHELTRYDKEEDRTNHTDAVNAHNGPVVLLYRDDDGISTFLESVILGRSTPDAEVLTAQGALHQIFVVKDSRVLSGLTSLFTRVPSLYIADGHHRARSAVNVAERRKREGRFTEEAGRFMGVLFAENQVRVHGYSRLVTDLGSYTPTGFLKALGYGFSITPCRAVDTSGYHIPPQAGNTSGLHVIHMYLAGQWYECTAPKLPGADPISALDVEVLQKKVLEGLLGISDPRGDARLQYLGGARPLSDLEEKVDSREYAVAFSMQPVNVGTVLAIADSGGIMPPKSTWFEPKLLSGLTIHLID